MITSIRRWTSVAIAAGLILYAPIQAFDIGIPLIWQDEYFASVGVPAHLQDKAWVQHLMVKAVWWGVPSAIGALLYWLIKPATTPTVILQNS